MLTVAGLAHPLRKRPKLARCGLFSLSTEDLDSKSRRKFFQAKPEKRWLEGYLSYWVSVNFQELWQKLRGGRRMAGNECLNV